MVKLKWGVMEVDSLESMRRVRTLGLGKSIRQFNDKAVPGLGGIWFAKQLLWALLGIDMAERLRRQGKRAQNIETANAIEALACLVAITEAGGAEDSTSNRVKGTTKLEGKPYPTFAEARKRAYYITQPMRMSTVQPLDSLGLVSKTGSRFNSFSVSDRGHEFLELACKERFSDMRNKIFDWVSGKMPVISIKGQTALKGFLHPDIPLALPACHLLLQALQTGNEDRNNALNWLAAMKTATEPLSWSRQPAELHTEHWQALYAGSRLFKVRNEAIRVLNTVESQLAMTSKRELPISKISAGESVHVLREAAQDYLDTGYSDDIARDLCTHCIAKQEHSILRHLLTLDGRGLCLIGDMVVPGPAFRDDLAVSYSTRVSNGDVEDGGNAEAGEQLPVDWKSMHPLVMLPDISRRLYNLDELQADLLHQPPATQEGTT